MIAIVVIGGAAVVISSKENAAPRARQDPAEPLGQRRLAQEEQRGETAREANGAATGVRVDRQLDRKRRLAEDIENDPIVSSFLGRYPDLNMRMHTLDDYSARSISSTLNQLLLADRISYEEGQYILRFMQSHRR